MFERGPPKMHLRLRDGLQTERIFESIPGVAFTGDKEAVVGVLSGSPEEKSRAYAEIRSRMKAQRAGRVVRITVATAEAAAISDFGPYVVVESLASQDRFVVRLKAKNRSAEYIMGRTGRIISKKESASAILDAYS
jgi:hypothetical protein